MIAHASHLRAALGPPAERLATYADGGGRDRIRQAVDALPTRGPAKVGHLAQFLAVLESARPRAQTTKKDRHTRPEGERLATTPFTQAFGLPGNPATLLKRSTLAAIAAELMSAPLYTRT
ncbi:MAG TPA: hypothetical protein VGE39_02480 [Prosthecobacter sp.]